MISRFRAAPYNDLMAAFWHFFVITCRCHLLDIWSREILFMFRKMKAGHRHQSRRNEDEGTGLLRIVMSLYSLME